MKTNGADFLTNIKLKEIFTTGNELKWLMAALLAGLMMLSSFAEIQEKKKPTLFLIGDSTVKNGKGKGDGGLWGWGNFIAAYFDTTRVYVQNKALGGTSSRTFRTMGLWNKVLENIKPGDFVMIQFGHNDNGALNDTLRARGTIKGNGNESQEISNLITKQPETVYTYGWYIRQYITDIKAKGAIPIVLSPVPRNIWQTGKINRNQQDYGKWAAEAAKQENAFFIDLNNIIADQYEAAGEVKVKSAYFNATDHTHTLEAGARLNATAVIEGLRKTKKCRLNQFLLRQPKLPDSIK